MALLMENKAKKKKILIMYDFFSEHGGIERIMLFQARTLKQIGFDVHFAFAYVDDKLRAERLKDFPVIEYAKLPFKNETMQICTSILRPDIINKFRQFDLIICHSFPASFLALKIKKKFGIPYVFHLHHPPQFLYNTNLEWAKNSPKRMFSYIIGKIFNPFLKKFDSVSVENADFYLTESKSVQRVIKETYGIEGTVLYPTYDNIFRILKKSELSKQSFIKGKFILASGRIIRQKRFDYLIEAFSKLKNKDAKLVFAGKYEEDMKKELLSLAENLAVKPIFLGPVPIQNLVKLYNLASLVVLTCPKEWFGLVTVEAMACGCPVVSWKDNYGPQEVIVNGKNGNLAEPYNISDLANKIEIALRKKWSKQIIRNSIQKFSEKVQQKVLISSLKGAFPRMF